MSDVNESKGQISDLSELKKMFSDFQKNQSRNKGMSKDELLAKYFVPKKPKETFRILPPKKGRKHIEEAFFHVVTTLTSGGKKKFGSIIYCPAHNDPRVPKVDVNGKPILDQNNNPILIPAPCPLCAKHKRELAKQDPSIKGIKKENLNESQKRIKARNDEIYKNAVQWEAKKFYIIRGIDKGIEKDGVKFWRFKHNFKNQGTLDKLLPILEDYMSTNNADFSDPINGTDLNIIMTDSEFNGKTYKAVSAITARGKSPLSQDPIVMRQWLDDDITWRDVFKPKKAPNVSNYEFLEMVANGVNPYWDDSDQSNKRWVFPGRPDLEEMANNRNRNLESNSDDENYEYASDLNDSEYPRTTISNITESKVGVFNDDAEDIGSLNHSNNESQYDSYGNDDDISDIDDLPF